MLWIIKGIRGIRGIKDGLFRAKCGQHIETEIRYNNIVKALKPVPVQKSITSGAVKQQVKQQYDNSYYGKDFIDICKKIRRLAYADKIVMDKALTSHKSHKGNNVHLIKLIEPYGVDIKKFIRAYLSVLQQFSFEFFPEKESWR